MSDTFSRREFLQLAGAFGAATAVRLPLLRFHAPFQIRCIFVGFGRFGAELLRAAHSSGRVATLAIVEPDPARQQAGRKILRGMKSEGLVYRSIDEVPANQGADVVVIATPDHSHMADIESACAFGGNLLL